MPVLLRPDGAVQVGWDPRRAVLVRPPHGLTAPALAELLRAMQSGRLDELSAEAAQRGVADAATSPSSSTSLVDAGVVTHRRAHRGHAGRVDPHPRPRPAVGSAGRCAALLGCPDRRTAASTHACRRRQTTDLVVLSDYPGRRSAGGARTARRQVSRTCRCGCATARAWSVRWSSPGVTSCLRCADLHRSDRDAAWPAVAAQLRDTVGSADRATVLATAALALSQVDRVIRAVRGGDRGRDSAEPPPTLDTTLEFDVNAGVDRGAPVVAASPLLVLTTLVATSLRTAQLRHG